MVKRASKGKQCLGVFGTGEKCKRARDQSGLPVVLQKKHKCNEWRCAKHCKCGRNNTLTGRSAARGEGLVKSKVKVVAVSDRKVPVSSSVVRGPNGTPSPPSCENLEIDEWYRRCLTDIKKASEVELASYIYDNPGVHKLLLQRLRGGAAFKLNLYIDAEKFSEDWPRYQKPRVRELQQAGASIYVCKGPKAQGAYHCKALVADRRYLYTGNANFTYKSSSNEELVFRMTGPVVQQVLEKLFVHRQSGKIWTGV